MDQIVPFDLERMFVGTEPILFYLEIIVRTVIIYAYALLLLRWLGSRTVGQLSTVEFLLVIALGSAIGDPMLGPDVPLLQAMLVVTLVVGINKLLDLLIARFKSAERIIDGTPEKVVDDGVICPDFLKSTSMGTSQLFQQLRERGIDQLGQVVHAYIESDGNLTVFRRPDAGRPGLSIVPPWEIEKPQRATRGLLACLCCGAVEKDATRCAACGHESFTLAQRDERFASPTD